MRLIWVVLIVVVLFLVFCTATAKAYEGEYNHNQIMECKFQGDNGWQLFEVRDVIRCAFIRVGDASQRGTAIAVADRESSFYCPAYNSGGYAGLFQHSVRYWPGRYASYPKTVKWFDLPSDPFDCRTNAFITARMVGSGNWGPWHYGG